MNSALSTPAWQSIGRVDSPAALAVANINADAAARKRNVFTLKFLLLVSAAYSPRSMLLILPSTIVTTIGNDCGPRS